jgi:hypothetical protein
MATIHGHALFNLDRVLVAFFDSEDTAQYDGFGEPVPVVPGRWDVGKIPPFVICVADTAKRMRAKNWEVAGRIVVRTPILNGEGNSLVDQSTALEFAILKTLEDYVPSDDRPQPLCSAINAVAAIEGYDDFMLTNFQIQDVAIEEADDFHDFTISYKATVLNDSASE